MSFQVEDKDLQKSLNPVLKSGYFISKNSQDVSIPPEGIERAASSIYEIMKSKKYSSSNWKQHTLHPKVADERAIDWIFLVDLLNFSFWSEFDGEEGAQNSRFSVSFDGKQYTGYWSLCAAINRALEEGISITTPSFYSSESKLSDLDLLHVFRSSTQEKMPLLEERIKCIREAGKVLMEKFGGSFVNCIKESENSCVKLLNIIVESFSSFRDESTFNGERVVFYKRAQILIADIWACFEGEGFGKFDDIDEITMFADYRVPQALHYLGAISYSDSLLRTLESFTLLPSGSRLENEIRGCSIWAVELLRRVIKGKIERDDAHGSIPILNAIILDFFIWDFSKEHLEELGVPIHRTRSIYY
ncbi:7738_t:CDS:1 [Acaulospora colombiana]|uniref:7738_t:CDS:1 n=1 Tax=Acaulospora colombiana TaxID=27376 RepID=A0ACA9K703_9GLOM|nr:7738_t:CDS:1 [Acaulospora colombiana]